MLLLASGRKLEKVRFLLVVLEELYICCSICRLHENYESVACMSKPCGVCCVEAVCVHVACPW